ncbi:MAG: branched-chain amino acid ABC transporter permease [Burkholderiaceae bacterium]
MRFTFKTRYQQDLGIWRDWQQAIWYWLLIAFLLLAPLFTEIYYLTQLSFIYIYAIVGFGLMLLSGFTGQISMGHAAFLAIGAYAEAILQAQGWPFVASAPVAMMLAGAAGIVIGLPALRLTGIYLAIATLAFGFIVEEGLARFEGLTGGNSGMMVLSLNIFGSETSWELTLYYLALICTLLVGFAIHNLLRGPTGRAFVAIRDSEVSAQSMGVNLAFYKTLSFAISAAVTGLAGALYAHQIVFLSPEQFTLIVSIEFLMMVVIGGLGALHGAVFGAIFVVGLPELIAGLKDYMPSGLTEQPGLKATLFGIVLILVVLYEPLGIYGRWVKIRTYFSLFPLYKKGMFERQKAYQKSERVR